MRFAVFFICFVWSLPLLSANEESEIYQAVKSQVQKWSDTAMGVVGHLKPHYSSTEKPLLNRTSSDEFIQASDFTFTKEDWEGWVLSFEMMCWNASEIGLGRVGPSAEQLKRKFGKTFEEAGGVPVLLAIFVAHASDKKSNLGFSKEILDLDIYLIESHPVFGQEEIKYYKFGQLLWLEQLFTKEMFLEWEEYGGTPLRQFREVTSLAINMINLGELVTCHIAMRSILKLKETRPILKIGWWMAARLFGRLPQWNDN